jgi:hypothetical protein
MIPRKNREISPKVAGGLRSIHILFPSGIIAQLSLLGSPHICDFLPFLLKPIPLLRSPKNPARNTGGKVERRLLDPALSPPSEFSYQQRD